MLKFGNTFVNFGGTYLTDWASYSKDMNPLNLPTNTIRCKFSSGYTPTMGDTQTLVDSTNNIWDIYKESNNWNSLFNEYSKEHKLLEVLGANTKNVTSMVSLFRHCISLTKVALFDTSSVTDMTEMFYNCTSLTTVPLFNTSKVTTMFYMFYYCISLITVPLFNTYNVTDMRNMFDNCTSLTSVPLFDTSSVTVMDYMFFHCYNLTYIPLFDTSSVTDMNYMFVDCRYVKSGALALYHQASSQATPPVGHQSTFRNCGSSTTTGSTELVQIPSSWK